MVSERPATLLLVDSVTGLGGAELRTDDWALDFILTGSQKAMALPPGLAFGAASDAMMARSAAATRKGVYFDLQAFATNLDKLQTPNTPAVSLLYALRAQLQHIAREGLEARWQRHLDMAARTHRWVDETSAAHGLDQKIQLGALP